MKNKKVKQMLCDVLRSTHNIDIWYEDGVLVFYVPPHGFCEGDIMNWYFGWELEPYTSIKACDFKRHIKDA